MKIIAVYVNDLILIARVHNNNIVHLLIARSLQQMKERSVQDKRYGKAPLFFGIKQF